MAKKIGFEVTGTRPVCVDFRDGRAISFRPGTRFEAILTNQSVLRLLRIGEIRKLSPFEHVPPLPLKFGAPKRVQNIMKARAKVEAARKAATAKLEASRKAPPKIEEAKLTPKRRGRAPLKPSPKSRAIEPDTSED